MVRRSSLFMLASVVVAIGCDDARNPAGPPLEAPAAKFSDGRFAGGNDDFFFLPPIMADPKGTPNYNAGAFNAKLGPTVNVCRLAENPVGNPGADCAIGTDGKPILVASFTSNQVQVSASSEQYQVNWQTDDSNLAIDQYYRLQVFLGSVRLGFADIDPVANNRDLKNANTGEIIPLVDGRTLPVKFRIEHGALCTNKNDCGEFRVTAAGGTFVTNTRDAGVQLAAGALPLGVEEITLTIERVIVGSDNRCHGAASARLWLEFEGCYEITSDPDLRPYGGLRMPTAGGPPAVVAQCVEISPQTPVFGPLYDYLQPYKSHNGGELQRLNNIGVTFLDCEGFGSSQIGQSANPFVHFAAAGLRRLGDGFGRVFGVRTLNAIDLGLGEEVGVGMAFSRFGWAIGLEAETSGDDQEAGFGLPTEEPLEVHIRSLHFHSHGDADEHPEDVAGVPVLFTVADGDGYFELSEAGAPVRAKEVLTGPDGRASIGFTAASNSAVNTVTAASPTFDEESEVATYVIGGLPPDLVIENLVRAPVAPTITDPLTWSFTVRNAGQGVAVPSIARVVVTLEEEGTETIATFDVPVPRLLPGATASLTTPALAGPHDPGSYSAMVMVNGTSVVVEATDDNNTESEDFSVGGVVSHIVGSIVDNSPRSNPLPGTIVELARNGQVIAADTSNDVTAIYRFRNLEPGAYALRTINPGYVSVVETVTLESGEERELNFTTDMAVIPQFLSMQTGATFQLGVAPFHTVVWSGSNDNATITSTGLVTAVVGGENIAADAPAIATATNTRGATGRTLINSFDFDRVPREVTLVWNPVNTAVSYHVEWDIGTTGTSPSTNCGGRPQNCVTWIHGGDADVTTSSHNILPFTTFPTRWRITATLDCGTVMEPSPWVYFVFSK